MKNIGQTSQLTGLSQRMLRYFEEQGLLQPLRSSNGNRQFSETNISEILRIQKLHELGFTYPEIKSLLAAAPLELVKKGSLLLQKHHEAALDLQDKIHSLEMICYGEKRPRARGPRGQRTLDEPHRTAHALKGADECSAHFQTTSSLTEGDFSYWKLSWLLNQPELNWGEFTLFEILGGSSLLAIFEGAEKISEYENAWNKVGLALEARKLGIFPIEDLSQFFSLQEVVIEQTFLKKDGTVGFRALLPYSSLYSALGKADPEIPLPTLTSHELTYRNLNLEDFADFSLLAKWNADPSIRHLSIPHRDEKSLSKLSTAEEIRARYKQGGPFSAVEDFIILKDLRPIGHGSLIIDPPHKLTKDQKIGWFGITIGEKEWRSKGIGREVALHLENLARKHGATTAEVGVFEFNEPAQKLCRALGYEEFGRVESCTYWQGKYWPDIRFRKRLE